MSRSTATSTSPLEPQHIDGKTPPARMNQPPIIQHSFRLDPNSNQYIAERVPNYAVLGGGAWDAQNHKLKNDVPLQRISPNSQEASSMDNTDRSSHIQSTGRRHAYDQLERDQHRGVMQILSSSENSQTRLRETPTRYRSALRDGYPVNPPHNPNAHLADKHEPGLAEVDAGDAVRETGTHCFRKKEPPQSEGHYDAPEYYIPAGGQRSPSVGDSRRLRPATLIQPPQRRRAANHANKGFEVIRANSSSQVPPHSQVELDASGIGNPVHGPCPTCRQNIPGTYTQPQPGRQRNQLRKNSVDSDDQVSPSRWLLQLLQLLAWLGILGMWVWYNTHAPKKLGFDCYELQAQVFSQYNHPNITTPITANSTSPSNSTIGKGSGGPHAPSDVHIPSAFNQNARASSRICILEPMVHETLLFESFKGRWVNGALCAGSALLIHSLFTMKLKRSWDRNPYVLAYRMFVGLGAALAGSAVVMGAVKVFG